MGNYTVPRWFAVAARVCFAALMLLTSVYCLLAYIPDTYFAFIQAPFQPWVVELIRLHAYIYCALLAALSGALLAEYRFGRARRMAIEFIAFQAAVAVYFLMKRPFSHLTNSSMSFVWAVATLSPLIWIGLIDHAAQREKHPEQQWNEFRQVRLGVGLLAAFGIGVLYPGSAWLRTEMAGRSVSLESADFGAWAWALLLHMLFATFAVAVFNLMATVATRFRKHWLLAFCIYRGTLCVAVALLFDRVLLPSIPLQGLEASVYSAVIAITLVLLVGGLCCGKSTQQTPATPRQKQQSAERIALVVVALAAMYTVPALIGVMDWNSVLAKLWAAIVWLGVVALVARLVQPTHKVRYSGWVMIACAAVAYGAYRTLQLESIWPQSFQTRRAMFEEATGRHASFDASYEAIRDLLAVSHDRPCDPFCRFLREQTGIPPWIPVQPVETKLVNKLTPSAEAKPNIFIIVVDSLRRDYVSSYNPAVQFTPEIARFANESVVMRNSFTRYSGTTLSEPAIWAGSMMLHKHYVQPFHPMNNLEKLVETDNYDRFITVDTILRVLLKTSTANHRLDSGMTNWSDQDLCRTAPEAEEMIDQRQDTTRPIFLYTQPQNIHVVSLERARAVRPPHNYPGFNPSAATEIKRLDGCFGQFIHYLKSRRLYDNSIVVLTADHGESYGEFGHSNHAFGLTPQALRIPLIIHVPKSMRNEFYVDPEAIAFNIDVTPTLYSLLGHTPVVNDERLGRPLFTRTKEEHDKYLRDSYLVAVCYAAIYGLLSRNGEGLFIANEMDDAYQYFDLTHDPEGIHNLVDGDTVTTHKLVIRSNVQSIADLYHYRYHRESLLSWIMR